MIAFQVIYIHVQSELTDLKLFQTVFLFAFCWFEGVNLTTVILTSNASLGGCLLRAMSHFRGVQGIGGIRGCVNFGWILRSIEVECFEAPI